MSEQPLPWIVETTAETFERDVIERSRTVPVLLDFWAAWCQPCRLLSPVLERLADEYAGKFVLVKADTEALSEHASALGVRSIPAVFGLRNGQVVDGFVGVLPEAQIRAFLQRLMPSPAEEIVAEASELESSDAPAAEAQFRAAMQLDPTLTAARLGLVRALTAQGRLREAAAEIQYLERRGFLEPEAERAKAELTLREGAAESGDLETARSALAAEPDNPERQFLLAEALAASQQYGEALEISLNLVEHHRKGAGEDARKLMLAIFQLLPPDSELTTRYRRKLSLVL